MVGAGFALLGLSAWYWYRRWRGRGAGVPGPWLLRAVAASGALAFVAVQAGWLVTEFGRHPWLVHGFLRTSEGVTDRDGIAAFFLLFTALYLVITAALAVALLRWPHEPALGGPAGTQPKRKAEGHVS